MTLISSQRHPELSKQFKHVQMSFATSTWTPTWPLRLTVVRKQNKQSKHDLSPVCSFSRSPWPGHGGCSSTRCSRGTRAPPEQSFSTASFSKSSTEVFHLQSMHQMSKFCPFQFPHEKNLPFSSLPRHQLWNLCFGPVSKTTVLTHYSNKAFAGLKSLSDWFIHF